MTNLFYWNNILHDVLYQYGFDEPAGNFQSNNYGNGGAQGDPVWADAQDRSNTNNARLATPPDGQDPRMEIFLFAIEATLEALLPPLIVGGYAAIGADFGDLTSAVTVALVQAIDPADAAGPATTDACSPLTNAAAINGNIALVDRGECLFVEKAATAQATGAVGIVVVNNDGDALVHMSGDDPGVVIAAVFIRQGDGDALKAELDNAVTVSIETGVVRDSAFDNSIITHEYGHE